MAVWSCYSKWNVKPNLATSRAKKSNCQNVNFTYVWYQLETWLVAPYKKPDRDLPENEEFNNHVSMVRIRSEHAIGFLKGRFQSLKHLRVLILDERSHKFATYWVAACITIHAFVMQCEDEERSDSNSDKDPFIAGGLSSSSESNISPLPWTCGPVSQQQLQAANAQREKLKQALFCAKERRRQHQLQEEEGDTDKMDVVFNAE